MSQLSLIVTVLAIYFAVWLFISYLSSKKADSGTFFTGNRKVSWPIVAIAMLGAPVTGVTLVSVPGMIITKGFSYLQMCLGFFVGYLIISFVLIPVYYKYNIVSIYGYLERRFGTPCSKMGSWLFLVSKIIGVSLRFFVVCAMLQFLVFDPLGIPAVVCVLAGVFMVWLSTFRGGVKAVIWTDVLKSGCLLLTLFLSFWFIIDNLGMNVGESFTNILHHETSKIFYLEDSMDGKYFWKQFVAGIFIVVAMTGLDQDMMQRSLACRSAKASRKNLIMASLLQTFAISMLLFLGVLMVMFLQSRGISLPEKSDNLFATVAFHPDIPLIVGALFVLGLVSATFGSVGSALTAMTTTFTLDILGQDKKKGEEESSRQRNRVHASLSVVMAVIVILFFYVTHEDALSTVYTLISFTDGPILGLFLFGLFTKRSFNFRLLLLICILSPVVSWFIQWGAGYFFSYEISYELLIINSGLTFLGLLAVSESSSEKSVAYQYGR